MLPGLHNNRGMMNRAGSEEMEECTIHVSEFGSYRLGHTPGMVRAEKVCQDSLKLHTHDMLCLCETIANEQGLSPL